MRKLAFYARLAMQNLFKNRLFYGPNLLACTLCAALFYIFRFLAYSDMVPQMRGAYYVSFMLELGTIVLAVVMMSILIYANGFIMKRRQKELGLYNILGMEKRQVAHVLILESMFLGLGSLVLGLGTGVLFSKLALMGLLRLLKFEIPLGFEVSVLGMVETALVMGAVFLLLILRNLWILHLSRPVDLLRSGNVGEAEPHSRRFMAAMGVLFLGAGYTIAVTIRNPLGAFLLFFVAVLLVIVGNYCLFTATSVVILKALRKNKAFYYKPRHFTAVSGMLYRMKQNAKGMHNICILATMLLVTISTTVCMYAGSEEALRRMYPDEIALSGHLDTAEEALTGDFAALEADYRRAVEQAGLSADTLTGRLQLSFAAGRKGDSFSLYVENDLGMSVYSLDFMVLEDYNRLTGRSATLAPDEVLCYNPGGVDLGDTLRIAGESWRVKETLTDYPVHGASFAATVGGSGQLFFVLADRETLAAVDTLQLSAYGSNASNIDYEVTLNAGAGQAETRACLDALCQVWKEHFPAHGYRTSCRAEAADDYYGMNGSFLFLGIFLGLAFLIATVLMIYYKQISEGYEDRQRFVILQKVGMSRREVRATIRTQVLMVFFVPLLMAAVHMSFAFPMISRLLSLFSLNNVSLFLLCSLITFLVFALVYVAVYLVTARKYYQIVRL